MKCDTKYYYVDANIVIYLTVNTISSELIETIN